MGFLGQVPYLDVVVDGRDDDSLPSNSRLPAELDGVDDLPETGKIGRAHV